MCKGQVMQLVTLEASYCVDVHVRNTKYIMFTHLMAVFCACDMLYVLFVWSSFKFNLPKYTIFMFLDEKTVY